MKRNLPTKFADLMQNAPRISWGPKPKPKYSTHDLDVTDALLTGLFLGALVAGFLVWVVMGGGT